MTPTPRAVVIGGSAGALEALLAILPALPAAFPLPVIIVVHMPPGRDSRLAELLDAQCPLRVREAEDKISLRPGTVYTAPADYHLLAESNGRLSLSSDPPVLFSRPSIDVLFESAADAYGPGLLGVILSGANSDGADGLAAILAAGGEGLAQSPASAPSPAMPQAALDACPAARAVDVVDIAGCMQEFAAKFSVKQ